MSNSRMIYAFSFDGAIPGPKFLHKVDHRWHSPICIDWSFDSFDHDFVLVPSNRKKMEALRLLYRRGSHACRVFILGLPGVGSSGTRFRRYLPLSGYIPPTVRNSNPPILSHLPFYSHREQIH
jgi:hypothetical protein